MTFSYIISHFFQAYDLKFFIDLYTYTLSCSACSCIFFLILISNFFFFFFFSSRRRHTRWNCDWSSDVCSSDLFRSVRLAPQGSGPAWFAVVRNEGGSLNLFASMASDVLSLLRESAGTAGGALRSEERRVGKECRSRWSPDQKKKKLNERI